jgi:ATP-dependent DNA helicase RecQ
MGIDRSNIRFIIHAAMPKSVEHYQQETGRAGRDGLEAECVLLHSGEDFMLWKAVTEKSAQEAEVHPEFLANAVRHLRDMDRFCRFAQCRHRALVEYFGQTYPGQSCQACDLCLPGDNGPALADSQVIAQKILSCVARVKERFGINHVAQVLHGADTDAVRSRGHDRLSTYGLLKEHDRLVIQDWIRQLVGQGVLALEGDEYPILRLNKASWEIMKGQRSVPLGQPVVRERVAKSRADTASWEGVDRNLVEALRRERARLAQARQVLPYLIFSDATLRELARIRPSNLQKMHLVYGIGEVKLRDFGETILQLIQQHCQSHNLSLDISPKPVPRDSAPPTSNRPNPSRDLAFNLYRQGTAIEDVMHQTGRGRSTVVDYLCEFIRLQPAVSISPWLADNVYQKIAAVAKQVGTERLKPIFIALEEKVPYDEIRIAVAFMMKESQA